MGGGVGGGGMGALVKRVEWEGGCVSKGISQVKEGSGGH